MAGAAAVAAAAELPAATTAILAGQERRIVRLLYDQAIAQSLSFAALARERGAAVFGFRIDPARLWFDQVRPILTHRSDALAGLTSQGSLFFLERLAWDNGLRLVMRIDHAEIDGVWHHGSAGALPDVATARLQSAGAEFGACAAELVLTGPVIWRDCTHAVSRLPQGGDGSASVSWVLARPLQR